MIRMVYIILYYTQSAMMLCNIGQIFNSRERKKKERMGICGGWVMGGVD